MTDEEITSLRRRVEAIERHLGFDKPPLPVPVDIRGQMPAEPDDA